MRALMQIFVASLLLPINFAWAETVKVEMHEVSAKGVGNSIGTVVITDDKAGGITIMPKLHGLTPGKHGFHVHENPSCQPGEKDQHFVAALAAGGHFDPQHTDKHAGPMRPGHLGDLPVLSVAEDGTATTSMKDSRLAVSQLHKHALMIHEGGDNYSDTPKPLGGGGARVACGVIE